MNLKFLYACAAVSAATCAVALTLPATGSERHRVETAREKVAISPSQRSLAARAAQEGTLVYECNFDTYNEFAAFTILDKNGDNVCWDWNEYQGKKFAYCNGTAEYNITSNDWLISPSIALQEGRRYRADITVQLLGYTEEKVEVKIGRGTRAENMTMNVVDATVMGEDYAEESMLPAPAFAVAASGDYNLGIHLISEPYTSGIAVLSLKLYDLGSQQSSDDPVRIYSENFESTTSMQGFTIIDANGDGAIWSHDNTGKRAQYTYSSKNAGDDWLLTPAIEMKPGRNYQLRFKAEAKSMAERIEVRLGESTKLSDQTKVLVAPTEIAKRQQISITSDEWSVSAEGNYYISFHAISDADADKLYIDDIEVYDMGSNGEDPGPGPGPEPKPGLPVPYVADLSQPTVFADFVVHDHNNDGRTWKYDPIFNTTLYMYSKENAADDWLMSPAISLLANVPYRLTITAKSRGEEYPERFEAMLGHGDNPEDMTIEAIAPTVVAMGVNDPAMVFSSGMIRVDADGNYNIGIHAISDVNMSDLLLYEVRLEEVFLDAPLAVTDLQAVADPTGEHEATVSFNAPTHNIGGNAIAGPITKIEVLRDGSLVETLSDVTPGTACSVVDRSTDILDGICQYTVVPYVGEHAGTVAQVSLFIGTDIPTRVTNLRAEDTGSDLRLWWSPVSTTGVNGGVVYPAGVSYRVDRAIPEYFMGMLVNIEYEYITTVTDTEAFVSMPDFNEGEYEPVHFAVTPINKAGEGDPSFANMLKGAPYSLPFMESVAGFSIDSYIAMDTSADDGDSGLYMVRDASDDDGGAFALVSYQPNVYVAMFTGKIRIKDAAKPVLTFDTRNFVGTNLLTVQVIKADASMTPVITDFAAPRDNYRSMEVDLTNFADQPWVRLVFAADYPGYVDATNGNELDIDNIRVYDAEGSGVVEIESNPLNTPFDIYDLNGRLLRRAATSLEGLPAGVVIANGHKYIIR